MLFSALPPDIARLNRLSDAMSLVSKRTTLFEHVYALGLPKFYSDPKVTAFVGLDEHNRIIFGWGREFFDLLANSAGWTPTRQPSTKKGFPTCKPGTAGAPPTPVAKVSVASPLQCIAAVHVHECLHVALNHLARAKDHDPKLWNIACDVSVQHLVRCYDLPIIPGSIHPDQYADLGVDPRHQTTEQIYDILAGSEQANGAALVFDPASGDHSGWPSLSPDSQNRLEDAAHTATTDAATDDADTRKSPEGCPCFGLKPSDVTGDQSDDDSLFSPFYGVKEVGDNPLGELRGYIRHEEPVTPLKWDEILLRYLGSIPKRVSGHSWYRQPIRLSSLWRTVRLPSKADTAREYTHRLLVALDLSGSIDEVTLAKMVRVVESLPKEYLVEFVTFDTKVYPATKDLVDLQGGGGTNLKCVIDHVESLSDVDVTIVMTDGYFPQRDPWPRHESWVFLLVSESTDQYIPEACRILRVD